MATLTADSQPQARPHAERLRFELNEIREGLTGVVGELTPDTFSLPPAEGLRTAQNILQEIGTMEVLSLHCAMQQEIPDWNTAWAAMDASDAEGTMAHLSRIRAETLAYLDTCTEETLETPIRLPDDWREYFGNATHLEPEELLRWIGRHEYYHLGQLYTYSFLRGVGK